MRVSLICNQQVGGSNPSASSNKDKGLAQGLGPFSLPERDQGNAQGNFLTAFGLVSGVAWQTLWHCFAVHLAQGRVTRFCG